MNSKAIKTAKVFFVGAFTLSLFLNFWSAGTMTLMTKDINMTRRALLQAQQQQKEETECLRKQLVELEAENEALALRVKHGVVTNSVKRAKFEVTMYMDNEPNGRGGRDTINGATASGYKTSRGAVAAPRSVPFLSQVILDIDDPKWKDVANTAYTVVDRGGAIREKIVNGEAVYCIDVWTDSEKEMREWGRRTVDGWLIINDRVPAR